MISVDRILETKPVISDVVQITTSCVFSVPKTNQQQFISNVARSISPKVNRVLHDADERGGGGNLCALPVLKVVRCIGTGTKL